MPALLPSVVFFEERCEVYIHERRPPCEAATNAHLNTAFRQLQLSAGNANPDSEWVAPEVFYELVHGS